MLKNYFLLGFRTLLKRKLYSIINISGLALALGCSLVCFAFVSFFYQADQFHSNVDRLFTIQSVFVNTGKEQLSGKSPLPIGDQLAALPAIESMARVNRRTGLITIGEETFEDVFTFADANFFQLFTFPLESGTSSSWGDPSSIIFSKQSAIKYFGDENPVGKSVTMRFTLADGQEIIQPFTVAGVADEFPRNASLRFRMLLPFNFQERLGLSLTDWTQQCNGMMLLLRSKSEAPLVQQSLQSFVSTYNTYHPYFPMERLQLEPLTTASLNSYKVDDDLFGGAPKFVFVILIVISFFLVLMACFNYMNIAIAMASYRLKEIGVRKVMGSARSQLIKQFLAENLILCLLALIAGLLLAETLFVPAFSSYFGLSLWLDYSNPVLWITYIGLLLLSALGGAGYPAFYVSSFQPVTVLKDKVKITGKSLFRRSLLSFQFFLSYVSITTAIAFILNNQFQREKDWGYNHDNKIVVKVNDPAARTALINSMGQNPAILGSTGSTESFGRETGRVVVKVDGSLHTIDRLRVGNDFVEVMELPLMDGRGFSRDNESGNLRSIVVNELFLSECNIDPESAIGKTIFIHDDEYSIIGLVRDFHFASFTELIKPLVLQYAPEVEQQYIAFRYAEGQTENVKATLKTEWKKFSPEKPLVMYEQNSVFDHEFQSYDTATQVMKSAALINVLIGIFGLFGISSLTLSGKIREMAIRKVMGSNLRQMGWQLNSEIVVLIGIAAVFAVPLTFLFLKSFLLNMSLYAMPLRPGLFVQTLAMLLAIAALSVSFHIFRLARISPTKHLRED